MVMFEAATIKCYLLIMTDGIRLHNKGSTEVFM